MKLPSSLIAACRSVRCFVLFAAVLSCLSIWSADRTWCGKDGDSWSIAENWDPVGVPGADETAKFYDAVTVVVSETVTPGGIYVNQGGTLMFSGSGKIRQSQAIASDMTLRNGSIVFDGPDFEYGRGTVSLGDGAKSLTFKKGSVSLARGIQGSSAGAAVIVDGASVTLGSSTSMDYGIRSRAADMQVTVKSGTLTTAVVPVSDNGTLALALTGGALTLRSVAELRTGDSLTVSGGTLALEVMPTLAADASLSVTGGALELGSGVNVFGASVERLIASGSFDSVLSKGAVTVPDDGHELRCKAPLLLPWVTHAKANDPAVVRCETLVFGPNAPFPWGNTANRWFEVQGPTTIRPRGNMNAAGQNAYVKFYGPIVVDTRDWTDGTTPRTVHLHGLISGDGSLELTVKGGGTLIVNPAYVSLGTVRTLTVEEGTTLQISDHDVSAGSAWTQLAVDTFTLKAGAKLRFNAGGNHLEASKWNVDPTAVIEITVPDAFPQSDSAAYPLLSDLDSKTIPSTVIDRVSFVNFPATGAAVAHAYGQYSIVTTGGTPGTLGDWEWTGGGADSYWDTAANWQCGERPSEKFTANFGASSVASSYYRGKLIQSGGGESGTTVGTIQFAKSAAVSFLVDGSNCPTFDMHWRDTTKIVQSASGVPQVMNLSMRVYAPEFDANGLAPLLFGAVHNSDHATHQHGLTKREDGYAMTVYGDVRFGYAAGSFPQLSFSGSQLVPLTAKRFTVLPAGSMTYSAQSSSIAVSMAGLRVSESGSLAFNGTAFTMRTSTSAKTGERGHSHDVDGTLTFGAPFHGGDNHSFSGKGAVTFGSLVSETANSYVNFGGTITANLPNWTTATAGGEAYALALSVRGTPTLKVPDDWTYGPAAGVTPSTSPALRTMRLNADATATVDAAGGTIHFVDPFGGPGTLRLVNAKLALDGSFVTDSSVAVAEGGELTVSGEQAVWGVSVAEGGKLTVSEAGCLVKEGDFDVEGLAVGFDGTGVSASWRSVLVAKDGKVVGTPSYDGDKLRVRIVHTARGDEFQCKLRQGLAFIFR